MLERLESLENRYESLTRELSSSEVQAQPSLFQEKARAHAELEEVVGLFRRYKDLLSQLKQAEEMLRTEKDPELQAMAKQEVEELQAGREALEGQLKSALLPKDPSDSRNAFLEFRAGTGGDEAALFAGEL